MTRSLENILGPMTAITARHKRMMDSIAPVRGIMEMVNSTMDSYKKLGIGKNMMFELPTAMKEIMNSPAFTTMQEISRNHHQLFEATRGVSAIAALKPMFSFPSFAIPSMDYLTLGIGKIVAGVDDVELLEDYNEFSAQAVELTDQATPLSPQERTSQICSLIKAMADYCRTKKASAIIIIYIIDLLLRFASAHQYWGFLSGPEPASSEQVEEVRKLVIELKEQLPRQSSSRIASDCPLRTRPAQKAGVTMRLLKGDEVILHFFNHKWAYVTATDNKNGQQYYGWILKKYLDKKSR